MATKHRKKESASSMIRKMQNKTTVRYYFILPRMALIKEKIITSVGKAVEKLEPSYTVRRHRKRYRPLGKVSSF